MSYNERLAMLSKVEWTDEEIEIIEKEEGFKIIKYNPDGKSKNGEYKYEALVEWI